MNKPYQVFNKSVVFFGAICGGLLFGLSSIPQGAVAQQLQQPQPRLDSKVNPCPRIFYEEPHNNRVLVPQGCPPNALTRQQSSQGGIPTGAVPANPTEEQVRLGVGGEAPDNANQNYSGRQQGQVSVIAPPSPNQQQSPIASVTPTNGQVSVKIKNDTNAAINYEVIGHTERRVLAGGQEVVLQNLPVPVTITTVRQDNGFVRVIPVSTKSGMIEFSLDEQANPGNEQGVIRIQQSGQVYLN
ncbi:MULTISPECIES: hypothetical protein [Nostocales]|uniref:Uncharacterized protein n=3 Tax=Nostocales TaxID=1161 RepID=A0A0C1N4X5_9CYAN|nr:hypothetical protein [Tolypothrix bouteillei]KAF3889041.1 hypothetical protein DA73_0400028860 [Tolypothrix bouteillei VB521301]